MRYPVSRCAAEPHPAPIIVYASISLIPQVILYEAALSYLGVGVTDRPSWGQMISDATPIFNRRFSVVHASSPGSPCYSLVLAFNLVGDALHRRAQPARRRS